MSLHNVLQIVMEYDPIFYHIPSIEQSNEFSPKISFDLTFANYEFYSGLIWLKHLELVICKIRLFLQSWNNLSSAQPHLEKIKKRINKNICK